MIQMTEVEEKLLTDDALEEMRDWLLAGAPCVSGGGYVAGVVGRADARRLFAHISALRASLTRVEEEREEFALRWSNCAMRNAIALREIQLLAAAGLESGCVEGDDEYTLFTSIHRLSCEQQGTDLSRASDAGDRGQ